MKKGKKILFLAVVLAFCTAQTAIAATCADWQGTWQFTYNGVAETVTITNITTNDGFYTCKATGTRASGTPIMIAMVMMDTTSYGYYQTTTPDASTPYDRIPANNFTGSSFSGVSAPTTGTALNSGLTSGTKGGAPTTTTTASGTTTTPVTTTTPGTTTTPATTTIASGAGTCADWEGTWSFTYDDGDADVKICDIKTNVEYPILPGMPFPCVAHGFRTDDGQSIFIMLSPFSTTDYYYYEIEAIEGQLTGGAKIPVATFTTSEFAATAPNNFGLVSGTRTDANSCDGGTDNCTDNDTCNCIDKDGDGYGKDCPKGPDCDDNDASVHDNCECTDDNCTSPCDVIIYPSSIHKRFCYMFPIRFFVIFPADTNQDIAFIHPVKIDWGTNCIVEMFKMDIVTQIVVGFIYIKPMGLPIGKLDITMTTGDNKTTCVGPIEIIR